MNFSQLIYIDDQNPTHDIIFDIFDIFRKSDSTLIQEKRNRAEEIDPFGLYSIT